MLRSVPDFRLQRPEYLGGMTWTFDGHVVPQTSETGTTPQANLTQFSQSRNDFHIDHSFVEHGVFMILLSCRSNMTYQGGLARELSYKTRYDFNQPEFANIGEVAMYNQELSVAGSANDTLVYGYNEYGYELRYSENQVSGEMRSNFPTSKDSKHMAYDFSNTTVPLSDAFITSFTPIERNIVVNPSVADPIELNCLASGKIARTLPMYSIPGLYRL